MAFSAPGPCCMQNAPIEWPEVTREIVKSLADVLQLLADDVLVLQ